ncbi:hypothetical protein GCM10010274_57480 [Streptomyces lavendofoliae]|uniref:Uncharacterized protein n=1 Tax=Streptomyces lavendofoliae TaxID=67314 RepID=A0A918I2Z2_9ACTN|nr:hypothetical protein GCM10010274_57480 [Streptomyces lavendofoliae]
MLGGLPGSPVVQPRAAVLSFGGGRGGRGELADAVAGCGWSAAVADDALVDIGTLAAALAQIVPYVRETPAR